MRDSAAFLLLPPARRPWKGPSGREASRSLLQGPLPQACPAPRGKSEVGKRFLALDTRNRRSGQLRCHLARLPCHASDSCVLLRVIRFLSPRRAFSSKPGVLNSLAYRGRHVRQMRTPAPGAASLEGTLLRLAGRPRSWKSGFSWDTPPSPSLPTISREKTPACPQAREGQNASVQGHWTPTTPAPLGPRRRHLPAHVPRSVAGFCHGALPAAPASHAVPGARPPRRPRVLRPAHCAVGTPPGPL